jgi:hypothetical protein
MSAIVMTERIAEVSPRVKARLAGVLEVLEGATSAGGQVAILGSLVVAGGVATTATNILGHQSLVWLGFAATLSAVGFHLAWAFLFYDLFKVVNRSLSVLSLLIILVGCAIQAVTALLYVAPLLVLQSGSSLGAFTPQQVQALALVFVKLNAQAFDTYLVFFGLWCVLIGYLIFRSTFLPRILGVLLMIDGVGWATYLVTPFASSIFPVIALASGLAELPLMFWLVVFGLNAERWKEQAHTAQAAGFN